MVVAKQNSMDYLILPNIVFTPRPELFVKSQETVTNAPCAGSMIMSRSFSSKPFSNSMIHERYSEICNSTDTILGYESAGLTVHPPPCPKNDRGWDPFFRIGV